MKQEHEYPSDWSDEDPLQVLRDALIGHRVVSTKFEDDYGIAVLDDGTELTLGGNEGCGGCYSGWYYIVRLAEVDNIITEVKVDKREDDASMTYTVFVFADGELINFAQFDGDDGNDYYGTGFWFTINHKEEKE